MAKKYVKNENGYFELPVYTRFWFRAFVVIVCLAIISAIYWLSGMNFLWIFSIWFLAAMFPILRLYRFVVKVRQKGSLSRVLMEHRQSKILTNTLLSTMTVNLSKDTPDIVVPDVTICDSRPSHISVNVEKLPGMYDIERLREDINASFTADLSGFVVTSAMVDSDGTIYHFILEDVSVDKTWRPKSYRDLRSPKYILRLQDGLDVNLSERPHIAVWGKTGSKKTTVLLGMVLQLFRMGADVRFIDGKDEFSAFKEFYPVDKIVFDVQDVLAQIDDVLQLIKHRQQILADESKKQQKMGLKASEVGLSPVVLIADEIGSIVALMDSKQSKQFINGLVAIIQRGRSVGVSVIISTQDPSVDTLPQKIRQQFSTKILMGSANGDIQRMAFGEVATVGDVEDFRGFYTCDGLTKQPMKFYVCDLYSHGFNELGMFKKAYQLGQNMVEYTHEKSW